MIVCVLLPRFELAIAAGGRRALLGDPAALAPEPGREQLVGEVSPAAEAFGIHPGMRLGEALARCPALHLVPPDPVGVADAWEGVLARLEGIGARVEPVRPGEACFDATGLRRLHGGHIDGVVAAVRAALAGADAGTPRIGLGPSRFAAMAAAEQARARRPGQVTGASDLARMPVKSRKRFTAGVAGLTQNIAKRLAELGKPHPERLAASMLAEMVGALALSLGSILGPDFAAAPAILFGPDRFHPSAAGYRSLAAVLLPSMLAALGLIHDDEAAPEAVRGEGVLPITTAALQAVNTPGTELDGTEVAGRSRGVRGLWVELRHRRRQPHSEGEAPQDTDEDVVAETGTTTA